jgi:predicted transposase/invertase (TIGR01784 family)
MYGKTGETLTKLEYTFKNDTLFKMVFVKYPDLLKQLVSNLLSIKLESIKNLEVVNSEMPPEAMTEKFCRLDINMIVDGKRVDLEIQVNDEGDYPERSLYYWARDYSSALNEGKEYRELPETIIVSIVDFNLFDCMEYHSEFRPMEVKRHEVLTNRMCLHYFELKKLPKVVNADDKLRLWLSLFRAETEEELKQIEKMGVPVMKQAIKAYRHVSATSEFKNLERLRFEAKSNEASALGNAVRKRNEEIARNLLNKGIDVNTIAEATGLFVDDILRL